jgi:hypothetical protein
MIAMRVMNVGCGPQRLKPVPFLIDNRSAEALRHPKSQQGLKPVRFFDALRGAKAPLFHGTTSVRGSYKISNPKLSW